MAQTARPDSLVSNVGWTASSGSNFWDLVDEAVADDGDYIGHPGGGLDTIELGLESLSDPMSSSNHTIYFRARWVTLSNSFNIILMDGATTIATHSPTLTNSFADYSYTLSAGEANSIVGYSDLRIQCLSSGNPVDISQIYFEVPNAASGSGGFTSSPSLIEATSNIFDSPNPKGNGKSSEILLLGGGTDSDYERMWRQQYKPRTLSGAKQTQVCRACGMYCSGDFITYFRGKPYCPDHAPRETNRGPNAVRI